MNGGNRLAWRQHLAGVPHSWGDRVAPVTDHKPCSATHYRKAVTCYNRAVLSEPASENRLNLDVCFPSDPRLLKTIRGVVGEMAMLSGFAQDEVQFIMLAVDEACANVIRHAYAGRTNGEVRLCCRASGDRVEFRLVDHGLPPPDRFEPRSLDEVRPGGLGLHLIRSIMDEVRFESVGDGNELYLAKCVRPQKLASPVKRAESGAALE